MQKSNQGIVDPALVEEYRSSGWWSDETIVDSVAGHAAAQPDGLAYLTESDRLTWAELDQSSTDLATCLVSVGVQPGDRVAVRLVDSPTLHLAFLAVEKAGATVVGVGARAGRRETSHLLERTRAAVLVTALPHAGQAAQELLAALGEDGIEVRHLVLEGPADGVKVSVDGKLVQPAAPGADDLAARRLEADDLYLINSTSGTTGLPKCVQHTQNRRRYFHQKAQANGRLTAADVFLGAVPAPFGFGLWTSHITPITLGAPTVLLERFSPEAAFAAIEREGVSVLCCVSTQFIMMLASPALMQHDLSTLRVLFTGGEAVPFERALDFEDATGATILQFYGSNETGLLSGTTLDDTVERRLGTAGRVVPEMQVRLFDGDRDVTDFGRGQPACQGPATSVGYLDDDVANEQLVTEDGWMLMGDICEIDPDGYLTVVGRTSDFIIRGGKNISALQVEAEVGTHPSVAHVAAVAMPDPVFGERVCVYAELIADASLTLADLVNHLGAQGISKEIFPERLIVLDELPRSSGAKVAKGELRADIRRRVEVESFARSTPSTRTADESEPQVGAHE